MKIQLKGSRLVIILKTCIPNLFASCPCVWAGRSAVTCMCRYLFDSWRSSAFRLQLRWVRPSETECAVPSEAALGLVGRSGEVRRPALHQNATIKSTNGQQKKIMLKHLCSFLFTKFNNITKIRGSGQKFWAFWCNRAIKGKFPTYLWLPTCETPKKVISMKFY